MLDYLHFIFMTCNINTVPSAGCRGGGKVFSIASIQVGVFHDPWPINNVFRIMSSPLYFHPTLHPNVSTLKTQLSSPANLEAASTEPLAFLFCTPVQIQGNKGSAICSPACPLNCLLFDIGLKQTFGCAPPLMAAMYFYTRLEMCHFQQKWWTQKADFENDPFFVWLKKKVNVLKRHQFKNHKRTNIKKYPFLP